MSNQQLGLFVGRVIQELFDRIGPDALHVCLDRKSGLVEVHVQAGEREYLWKQPALLIEAMRLGAIPEVAKQVVRRTFLPALGIDSQGSGDTLGEQAHPPAVGTE